MAELFIPIQQTLTILLGVRFACSYSAMKKLALKSSVSVLMLMTEEV